MHDAIIGQVQEGQKFDEIVKELLTKVPDGVRVMQIRYCSPDQSLVGNSMMDNKTGYMVVFIEPVGEMPFGVVILDTVILSSHPKREHDPVDTVLKAKDF